MGESATSGRIHQYGVFEARLESANEAVDDPSREWVMVTFTGPRELS